MNGSLDYSFSDLALSKRLEAVEGQGCASFVNARASMFPDSGAESKRIAGTFAMFDGPNSPITQTFGMGVSQPISEEEFNELERFFNDRDAPALHEVSPLADASAIRLLTRNNYEPFEFTNVMHRPISADFQSSATCHSKVTARPIVTGEEELWSDIASRGWSDFGDFSELMSDVSQINQRRHDSDQFVAEIDGTPVAAGSLSIFDGVVLLAGAATVPEARKQGAQLVLLETRLTHAARRGCDTAMICAQPGSASQRNAERHGFRIAYTRMKWRRPDVNG